MQSFQVPRGGGHVVPTRLARRREDGEGLQVHDFGLLEAAAGVDNGRQGAEVGGVVRVGPADQALAEGEAGPRQGLAVGGPSTRVVESGQIVQQRRHETGVGWLHCHRDPVGLSRGAQLSRPFACHAQVVGEAPDRVARGDAQSQFSL